MIENGSYWKLTVSCDTYNHQLVWCLEGHLYEGELTNEEMNLLLIEKMQCSV